jgi:hypothetical protein
MAGMKIGLARSFCDSIRRTAYQRRSGQSGIQREFRRRPVFVCISKGRRTTRCDEFSDQGDTYDTPLLIRYISFVMLMLGQLCASLSV